MLVSSAPSQVQAGRLYFPVKRNLLSGDRCGAEWEVCPAAPSKSLHEANTLSISRSTSLSLSSSTRPIFAMDMAFSSFQMPHSPLNRPNVLPKDLSPEICRGLRRMDELEDQMTDESQQTPRQQAQRDTNARDVLKTIMKRNLSEMHGLDASLIEVQERKKRTQSFETKIHELKQSLTRARAAVIMTDTQQAANVRDQTVPKLIKLFRKSKPLWLEVSTALNTEHYQQSKELERSIDRLDIEISSIEKSYLNNDRELSGLAARLEDLRGRNMLLESIHEKCEIEKKKRTDQNAELTSINVSLNEELTSATTEKTKLKRSINTLTGEKVNLFRQNSSLEKSIEDLRTEKNFSELQVEGHQKQLQTLTEHNATLNLENSKLKARNKALQSERDSLQKSKESLESKQATLTQANTTMNKINGELTTKVERLKSDNENILKRCEDMDLLVKSTHSSLRDTLGEVKKVLKEDFISDKLNDHRSASYATSLEAVKLIPGAISTLILRHRDRQAESVDNIAGLNTSCNKLKADIVTLNRQVEISNATIDADKTTIRNQLAHSVALQNKLRTAENATADYKTSCEAIGRELEQERVRLETASVSIERKQEMSNQLSNDLSNSRHLLSVIQDKKKSHKNLVRKKHNMLKACTELLTKTLDEKADAVADCTELRSKLQDANNAYDLHDHDIGSLRQQVQHLSSKLVDMTARADDQGQELQLSHQEADYLQKQLSRRKLDFHNSEEARKMLALQYVKALKDLQDTSTQCDTFRSTVSNMNSSISVMTIKVSESADHVNSLETAKKKLEGEVESLRLSKVKVDRALHEVKLKESVSSQRTKNVLSQIAACFDAHAKETKTLTRYLKSLGQGEERMPSPKRDSLLQWVEGGWLEEQHSLRNAMCEIDMNMAELHLASQNNLSCINQFRADAQKAKANLTVMTSERCDLISEVVSLQRTQRGLRTSKQIVDGQLQCALASADRQETLSALLSNVIGFGLASPNIDTLIQNYADTENEWYQDARFPALKIHGLGRIHPEKATLRQQGQDLLAKVYGDLCTLEFDDILTIEETLTESRAEKVPYTFALRVVVTIVKTLAEKKCSHSFARSVILLQCIHLVCRFATQPTMELMQILWFQIEPFWYMDSLLVSGMFELMSKILQGSMCRLADVLAASDVPMMKVEHCRMMEDGSNLLVSNATDVAYLHASVFQLEADAIQGWRLAFYDAPMIGTWVTPRWSLLEHYDYVSSCFPEAMNRSEKTTSTTHDGSVSYMHIIDR